MRCNLSSLQMQSAQNVRLQSATLCCAFYAICSDCNTLFRQCRCTKLKQNQLASPPCQTCLAFPEAITHFDLQIALVPNPPPADSDILAVFPIKSQTSRTFAVQRPAPNLRGRTDLKLRVRLDARQSFAYSFLLYVRQVRRRNGMEAHLFLTLQQTQLLVEIPDHCLII